MKLISYAGGYGRVEGDEVVPLGAAIEEYFGGSGGTEGAAVRLKDLQLLAPVPSPGKIICVGLNYVDHAQESGQKIPVEPLLFGKYANSLVGDGGEIRIPPVAARRPDYEAELAIVIGRRTARIDASAAMDAIAGYTCANDVSARDLQVGNGQWHRGKAVDTFLPMGPWLVTPDEVADPQALRIRCLLNGQTMQDSTTADMIFSIAEIVAFISQTITLEPGDVICTGTPPGVGFVRTPPVYLQPGDIVEVDIESVGILRNTVVVEESA